ncbi:MAG: nucleotide pyrophosphohydrolase [archaeon]|nr:nucleotide pyrophosphohydrolase [archaeon]
MQISEFQKLMNELYLNKDSKRGINGTFMWFIEEIGEFSEVLRQYIAEDNNDSKIGKKKRIGEEMADIIAWLSSIANLLDIDLQKAMFDKYPNKCKKCSDKPCKCEKI